MRLSARPSVHRAVLLGAVLALVLLAVGCEIPERFRGYHSDQYADAANWLCRPGAATNHCIGGLDSTIVKADGSTQFVSHVPVDPSGPWAPVDCFYVYPTVNFSGGPNVELSKNPTNAINITEAQAARFSEVCNVYAPQYRQMTISAFALPPDQFQQAWSVAYGDVLAAFKHYMANDNNGRPIVLIGHSQGTMLLTKLIQDEFDNDPDFHSKLMSALLIGGTVQVPIGQDVGATFQHTPLCRSTVQTGCVVHYNSYGNPPPDASNALFGRGSPSLGWEAACVNPANLAGGTGVLKPYVNSGNAIPGAPPVTSPWVQLPNALQAACTSSDGLHYLQVSTIQAAGDQRDASGVIGNLGNWGLHANEIELTQGNLIDLVRSQTAHLRVAYRTP